jgi:hypothetical protein
MPNENETTATPVQTTTAGSVDLQRMVRALEKVVEAHQDLADAYAENRLPMPCESERAKAADYKRRLEWAKTL